jgi:hypothetical protein
MRPSVGDAAVRRAYEFKMISNLDGASGLQLLAVVILLDYSAARVLVLARTTGPSMSQDPEVGTPRQR